MEMFMESEIQTSLGCKKSFFPMTYNFIEHVKIVKLKNGKF